MFTFGLRATLPYYLVERADRKPEIGRCLFARPRVRDVAQFGELGDRRLGVFGFRHFIELGIEILNGLVDLAMRTIRPIRGHAVRHVARDQIGGCAAIG